MDAIVTRFGATALKRALLLGVIGALITGFMVVNTVSSGTIGPAGGGAIKLSSQAFSDATTITVVSNGVKIIPTTDAVAVGTTLAGEVEATDALPEVTTAVTKDRYAYEFVVKETAVADWASTTLDDLKIEVYGDDGTTTTLLATFYAKQGVLQATLVEGVTGTVDLGSTTVIYDNFDVVVTKQ